MLRNAFGIHTDVRGLNSVGALLQQCALIKVVFSHSEAGTVLTWKTKSHPNAYWIGRTSLDQDATNPLGELQAKYKVAHTEEEVRVVAHWYVDYIASWAIPTVLSSYMFFESGPNEEDPNTDEEWDRAIIYMEEFVLYCAQKGLLSAPGLLSYGKPPAKLIDGVDGWARWAPVFRAMDSVNAGHNTPQTVLQMHGYGMNKDIVSSAPYAIMRYLEADYVGPVCLGEYGYAFDGEGNGKPSNTEEIIRQLLEMNTILGSDDRFMGAALYDCRYISQDPYKWDYMYKDLTRALQNQRVNDRPLPIEPVRVYTGASIEVPPTDPPSSDAARVASCNMLNVRIGPGTNHQRAPLPRGTEVEVIGRSGDWAQIKSWVHSDYLEGL